MMTLLKMHFYMSRKLLVLSFFFILGVIAIQWLISNQINLSFFHFTPMRDFPFSLFHSFTSRLRRDC